MHPRLKGKQKEGIHVLDVVTLHDIGSLERQSETGHREFLAYHQTPSAATTELEVSSPMLQLVAHKKSEPWERTCSGR